MTDQPSEAALRKACEVLNWRYPAGSLRDSVILLARHFDAEDKAARGAVNSDHWGLLAFTRRHILPDPKPTVLSILRDCNYRTPADQVQALRDAGLLREGG